MTDEQKLILRINELFHDFEGKEYQKKHADIFSGETQRWQNAGEKYFSSYPSPITVLDVGTGTGFIPLTVSKYLKKDDLFICSDISTEMLRVAKENIEKENFNCKFKYIKTDGNELISEKITLITINSVLHHIPDFKQFFKHISENIIPGGRIIIGHEPNKKFYQKKLLLYLYLLFTTFSSFKLFVFSFARMLRINIAVKKVFRKKLPVSKMTKKINAELQKEGLIKKELSKEEINKLVDWHSPSSGSKIDKTKGIDIKEIQEKFLPDFEIEHFETYNFISKMSYKNKLTKYINTRLSKKFKHYGATFFVVLKKKR